MSNMQQSFDAGQTKGQTQEKASQWTENMQDKAQAAKDTTSRGVHSAQQSAEHAKDETSGFFQQTGEQVKSMAQGAVDGVKNTLGMNDSKK